jgi:uncharacterized protein YkwD
MQARALLLPVLAAGVGWLSTAITGRPSVLAQPYPGYVSQPPARWTGPPGAPAPRDEDLAFCVDETNRYRARQGRPSLSRSAALEAYAATGARYDTAARTPHRHFDDTRGGKLAWAENECLSFHGWSLWWGGGSVRGTVIRCLRTFYDEGPSGGHHENMMGEYRTLGCAVLVTRGGVTIVQDFGR